MHDVDDCLALRTEIVQLRWLGGSTSEFGDLIDASAWTHQSRIGMLQLVWQS
jgi:hypothetical protein